MRPIEPGKYPGFVSRAIMDGMRNRFSSEIFQSAKTLRAVSQKGVLLPTCLIPLQRTAVNKWARDLLSLKKLLCGLPKKIGMRPEEYADFFKMVPKMRRYLRHDGLKWVSPFFRPDCILTDTGPKVLEFNIDTGSMAFISGISLKL